MSDQPDNSPDNSASEQPTSFESVGAAASDLLSKFPELGGEEAAEQSAEDASDDTGTPAQDSESTATELPAEPDPLAEANKEREREEGTLRQSDYTRKMQALSQEKAQLEQQKAAFATERQQALQIVQQGHDPILSEAQNTDWVKLANDDPATYTAKRAAFEARLHQVQQMQSQQAQQAQAQYNTALEAEYPKLIKAIPEWKDPKVATKDVADIHAFLLKNGVPEHEARTLYQTEYVTLVRDAMKYRQEQAAKASLATKKVAPVQRFTEPSNGEASRTTTTSTKTMNDRLRRTGSIHDAVAAFNARHTQQ